VAGARVTAPRPHLPVAVVTDHGPAANVLPFRSRPPAPVPSPAPASPGDVLPLVAVLFTTVVAQVAVAPHLALAGASPDLLLLSTAAVAAAGGREVGVAYGFAAGLAADLFVATPFGLAALVFTVVGHRLGRGAGTRQPIRSTAMVGGLACLAGGGLVVSLGGLFAGGSPVPAIPVFARLVGGSIVAAVLAPAVYAAVRRLLHPSPATSGP
jgi:rod shape-determining protein MreD